MSKTLLTARNAGLISCRYCHTLTKPVDKNAIQNNIRLICPTCGSKIYSRTPRSLSTTLSLLIAAAILYIPANTLPVMGMVYLGQGHVDTIMSGVMSLAKEGLWPLAIIVFVASIVVPVLKLCTLFLLVGSVFFRSRWRALDRTRLYRVSEFIGRWSMVDIYVIGILTALVQFGNIATVYAGAGSLSFAAVIVLTMFAAHSFDPRLIWDIMEHPT